MPKFLADSLTQKRPRRNRFSATLFSHTWRVWIAALVFVSLVPSTAWVANQATLPLFDATDSPPVSVPLAGSSEDARKTTQRTDDKQYAKDDDSVSTRKSEPKSCAPPFRNGMSESLVTTDWLGWLVVATAFLILLRPRYFMWIIAAAVLAASVFITGWLACFHWRHCDPFQSLVFIATLPFVVWFGVRFLNLLSRFSADLEIPPIAGLSAETEPIPSHNRLLAAISDRIVSSYESEMSEWPHVIGIEGEWGAGKTSLMTFLRQNAFDCVENPPRGWRPPVVVYLDIWRLSSSPDMELQIYRALASRFDALWPYGWLKVAFLPLLIDKLARAFRRVGRLKVAGVEVATHELRAPAPIRRHDLFERLVYAITKSRRQVVLILDEVDRCAPLAVQNTFAFVRRGLSVPGVNVILPFVPAQLQSKLLNPSRILVDDLRSTAIAVLEQIYDDDDEFQSELRSADLSAVVVGSSPPGSDRTEPPASLDAPFDAGMTARVADMMHIQKFLKDDPLKRQKISQLLIEKIVSTTTLRIGPLDAEDVSFMIRKFPRIRSTLELCLKSPDLGEPASQEFVENTVDRAGRFAAHWLRIKLLAAAAGGEPYADSRFWTLRSLQRCLNNSLLTTFRVLREESATRADAEMPPLHPVDVRRAILDHVRMGLELAWHGHMGDDGHGE